MVQWQAVIFQWQLREAKAKLGMKTRDPMKAMIVAKAKDPLARALMPMIDACKLHPERHSEVPAWIVR